MTTYKITNIEIDTFNKLVDEVVINCKELIIEVNDLNTTFEEREELIEETMCKVLGLSTLDYSVNCTYEFIKSDCDDTWVDE